MKLPVLILSLLYLLCNFDTKCLFGQETNDKGFADYLYKQGEYYRAISEYYRLSYSYPDSTKKADLFRKIGLCYYRGQDYEGYISFLNKEYNYFAANSFLRTEMNLYLAKSFYHLERYQKAINTLDWTEINPDKSFINDRQLFLGITYARLFDWQHAIERMQIIEAESPQKKIADNLSASLKLFPDLPEKKPFWAGFMSAIIPGSGYVYCDRIGTGISAFVVNGLLIWAISDAIKHEQYGIAATAGFFGIGWYIGNITGSVEAAKTYNSYIRNDYVNKIFEKENLHEFVKE